MHCRKVKLSPSPHPNRAANTHRQGGHKARTGRLTHRQGGHKARTGRLTHRQGGHYARTGQPTRRQGGQHITGRLTHRQGGHNARTGRPSRRQGGQHITGGLKKETIYLWERWEASEVVVPSTTVVVSASSWCHHVLKSVFLNMLDFILKKLNCTPG